MHPWSVCTTKKKKSHCGISKQSWWWFDVAVLPWLPHSFLQGDVRAESVMEEVKKLRGVVCVTAALRRPKSRAQRLSALESCSVEALESISERAYDPVTPHSCSAKRTRKESSL